MKFTCRKAHIAISDPSMQCVPFLAPAQVPGESARTKNSVAEINFDALPFILRNLDLNI